LKKALTFCVAALLIVSFCNVASAWNKKYDVAATGSGLSGPALSDPGLVIECTLDPLLDSQIQWLDDGDSWTFDFMTIYTNEGSVQLFEDTTPELITANLAFDVPPGVTGITGLSGGYLAGFLGRIQGGYVVWADPVVVNIPGDRKFVITLNDAQFNEGYRWGTSPGEDYGATIRATITQVSSVPLPAAAWMGLGLLGVLGAVRRLRRKK
jgi:hypothetical protein